MTTWSALWRRLDDAVRLEAAQAYWVHRDPAPLAKDDEVVRFLARAWHLRPQSVQRMSDDRRSKLLGRRREIPEAVAHGCLLALHLHARRPLLTTFLDACGVAHNAGALDSEREVEVPLVNLVEGVKAVQGKFPASHIDAYLAALEIEPSKRWLHLHEARAAVGMAAVIDAPSGPEGEDPGQAPPLTQSLSQSPASQFTTLDNVLIDQVISALQESEGALEPEQVVDLVDEIVHLNSTRHRSYFHAGFVDSLQDLQTRWQQPEMNDVRRAWYLCGLLAGHARRDLHGRAWQEVMAHPEVARAIGDGSQEASELGAPLLWDLLLKAGAPGEIAGWMTARGVARAGPDLLRRVLKHIKRLLRTYELEQAAPLIDLLEGAVTLRQRGGDVIPEDFMLQVRRQRAHALRLSGDFAAARSMLALILKSSDVSNRCLALSDLGLMDAGYRALGDVRLPTEEADLTTVVEALAQGEARFQAAAEQNCDEAGHPALCLGMLHALRGQSPEALTWLSKAVAFMQKRSSVYTAIGILPRAQLLLALAIAESLDVARVAQSVEFLEYAARGGADSIPTWVTRRILLGLAATDLARAEDAIRRLHPIMGDRLLDPALASDLGLRIEGLRTALHARAADMRQSRARRFEDFEALLRMCRASADEHLAEAALDGLEGLASQGTCVDRLLKILGEGLHDPTWSHTEVQGVRVCLLEAAGRCREAAALLCQLGHSLLSERGGAASGEVGDVLAHVRELGAAEMGSDLQAHLDAVTASVDRPRIAQPEGVVLVVGGNETQAAYTAEVVRYSQSRWPQVKVVVRTTGWSSNWNKQWQAMNSVFAEAGAVVLLTMVRTMLGRTVRRACSAHGKPWVSCTGRGLASLQRSLATAVGLL